MGQAQSDLMSRVEFDANGGCWLWSARVNEHGYGTYRKAQLAHRVSYGLFVGDVPKYDPACPVVVMHTCDVPCCVNPAHLRLGTQRENIADRKAKGRNRRTGNVGKNHPLARLSEGDVLTIRDLCAAGERQKAVAGKFGVKPSNISAIVRRQTWRHL